VKLQRSSPRPPFRDNARLVFASALGALLLLVGVQALVRKSGEFSPDFLASVLLYGLTVLNFSLLIILVFVLGRNLIRMVMERRRGVLGARLRMRLLLVFLLMALGPAILVVVVGSDLIQQAVDRWFSVDVERILTSSQALGRTLRETVSERARVHAHWLASEIGSRRLLDPASDAALRRFVQASARDLRMDMVNVYSPAGERVAVMNPRGETVPRDAGSASALIELALAGRDSEATVPAGDGEFYRAAVPVHGLDREVVGAVLVSSFLPGEVSAEVREVEERYKSFRNAQTSKGPIKAVYLGLYLFQALLILFGAAWLSLYLARRITTPLRLVAAGTERIAAGERGVRVDFASGDDEFAALIESFNRMSERLARSEEEVEFSRAGLRRKNEELEERRRLTEKVLETVGTGIVVVDSDGAIAAINTAASELLDLDERLTGHPVDQALGAGEGAEVLGLIGRVLSGRSRREQREVRLAGRSEPMGTAETYGAPPRGGEPTRRQLAVTVVALPRGAGAGALVVVDDLTPLMRAQKVAAWGEVARKLAHEIKNPLTPIQLSAQRVRKAFVRQAPDLEKVITECTTAIVNEVEALKNLVDEFTQFARLPPVQRVSASLQDVIEQTLPLYDGQFVDVRFDRRFAPDVPAVRLDPDQMKRVLINLVDNAIEAMEKKGTVCIFTEFDRSQSRVRFGVADNGPGIPIGDRDKLFVPHFSTKRRGSGLGLAIVHRIIQEHEGVIRVEDNTPRGSRFVIEIPA
jgi:two-component system, NtrC family, nitrogen regulation sensor histidine kinase NtrY